MPVEAPDGTAALERVCSNVSQHSHLLLPEDALLGGEVDLDGGVAPRVVDLASVDLLDGHPAGETADLKGSCTIKIWYSITQYFPFFLRSVFPLSLRHITIAANGFLLPGEATAKEVKVKSRTEEMLSAHSKERRCVLSLTDVLTSPLFCHQLFHRLKPH